MALRLPFSLDMNADYIQSGTSRYGNYLACHQEFFQDDGDPTVDAVTFALMAWRVAMPPIMAPSFVRVHSRVQRANVHWDDECRAAIAVDIALPTKTVGGRRALWRDWTRNRFGQWMDPYDNRSVTALATLTVRVPVPTDLMPTPSYASGAPDTGTAKHAVQVLMRVLNAELQDLLAATDARGDER